MTINQVSGVGPKLFYLDTEGTMHRLDTDETVVLDLREWYLCEALLDLVQVKIDNLSTEEDL